MTQHELENTALHMALMCLIPCCVGFTGYVLVPEMRAGAGAMLKGLVFLTASCFFSIGLILYRRWCRGKL